MNFAFEFELNSFFYMQLKLVVLLISLKIMDNEKKIN